MMFLSSRATSQCYDFNLFTACLDISGNKFVGPIPSTYCVDGQIIVDCADSFAGECSCCSCEESQRGTGNGSCGFRASSELVVQIDFIEAESRFFSLL